MGYLFEKAGNVVSPVAEMLLIEPFISIWEKDDSNTKTFAKQELAYIEFMTSQLKSNPFKDYPKISKSQKIIDKVITIEGWIPDDLVLQGIDFMIKLQKEASATYVYYLAAKEAMGNMSNFFRTVDITLQNPKTGNPVYKPSDITSAINNVAKNVEVLHNLEKKVQEELYEDIKKRAGADVSYFATQASLR